MLKSMLSKNRIQDNWISSDGGFLDGSNDDHDDVSIGKELGGVGHTIMHLLRPDRKTQ